MMLQQPTFFIPHGGGPCFFMDDPSGIWAGMAAFLRGLPEQLPEPPKAILVVSGHWETDGFVLTGSERPVLIFDYYNFPDHTYALRYDVPGAPALAIKAAELLVSAGLPARIDKDRGLDHGVFIPLKVAFPDGNIPVVEMSLDLSLDPALHIAAGRALAGLRDEGVLILATGMSFHNLRAINDAKTTVPSKQFDDWLTDSLGLQPVDSEKRLEAWEAAPAARLAHPKAEHLLPVMVALGAASGPGERIYSEYVLKVAVSAFRFP